MTNETFEPTNIDSKRKQVDDFEDRLHSALDAKRDVASDYASQLDFALKRNQGHWQNGYDAGYAEGYNAGRLHGELPLNEETVHDEHLQSLDSMTEDEISQELVDAGYDVDELVESVQETIKAHEK